MKRDAEHELAEMSDRIARLEPRLDDLARERLLARVHAELEAQPRNARRAPPLALAALAAAAAAVIWWMAGPSRREPVARTDATVAQPRALELVPYLFSGGSAQRADALLGRAQQQIELASGERLLAALGDRARLALVGPAALRVRRTQDSRVTFELTRGLLLGDYEHDRGGELVIDAPGARAEIVGTLFSVRALDTGSQVAVARGQVRVRAGERCRAVHALAPANAPACLADFRRRFPGSPHAHE